MVDAPCRAGEVADDAGDERRQKISISQPPDDEHLDGKNRSGERCAKDRAEPGRDTGDEESATSGTLDAAESGKSVGETAAHLQRGALPSGRAAAKVRGERAEKYQRSHPGRHASAGRVDFVHDEMRAPLGFLAKSKVDPPYRETDDG